MQSMTEWTQQSQISKSQNLKISESQNLKISNWNLNATGKSPEQSDVPSCGA
jgi:hypothetical protein